jgi:hypothetical protein
MMQAETCGDKFESVSGGGEMGHAEKAVGQLVIAGGNGPEGEWIEDAVEVPGGITIMCAECYPQREADARLAGRRTIRHG